MIDVEQENNTKNPLNDHLSIESLSPSAREHIAEHVVSIQEQINIIEAPVDATEDIAADSQPNGQAPAQDINQQNTIPKTVTYLGIMMFLMNCAFVMTYSFSGLYLRSLGVPNIGIGFIEGIAEAVSHLMKFVSGVISDMIGRRKPVMYVGYALSVFARPIMATAMIPDQFLIAKMMERMGNGIQGSPRDAIVADITPAKRIGAAYGLKRSLATLGSIVGAIAGYVAMLLTNDNMRAVFWLACIPPLLAFAILIIFVREPRKIDHSAVSAEVPLPATKRRHKLSLEKMFLLGKTFWLLMLVNAIFMLARVSEQFIILHANTNYGLVTRYAPFIMIVFNLGWCLTSYPVGLLADRMNRYWLLVLGIILLVLASILFSSAANIWILFIGVLFWGFQYGITMNIFSSLIAETVPENLRGSGFAFYYIIMAISSVIAETGAGKLADTFGFNTTFIISAVIGLFALIVLIVIMALRTTPRKN